MGKKTSSYAGKPFTGFNAVVDKIVYVDAKNGSDDNEGKCDRYPFRTIDEAVRKTRCYNTVKIVVAAGTYEVNRSIANRNIIFVGSLARVPGDFTIAQVADPILTPELSAYFYRVQVGWVPGSSLQLDYDGTNGTITEKIANVRDDGSFCWPFALDFTGTYGAYALNSRIIFKAGTLNNNFVFSDVKVDYDVLVPSTVKDGAYLFKGSNEDKSWFNNAVVDHHDTLFTDGEIYLNKSYLRASSLAYEDMRFKFSSYVVEQILTINNSKLVAVYGLHRGIIASVSTVNLKVDVTGSLLGGGIADFGGTIFKYCKVYTNNVKTDFANFVFGTHFAENAYAVAGRLLIGNLIPLRLQSSSHYFAADSNLILRNQTGKLAFVDHAQLRFEIGSVTSWQVAENIYPFDLLGGHITGSVRITVLGAQLVSRYFRAESGSLIRLDIASYTGVPQLGAQAINYVENNQFFAIPAVQNSVQNTVPGALAYAFTVNTTNTTAAPLLP